MALTDTFIRHAKYSGKKSGDKHSDGGGMFCNHWHWQVLANELQARLHGKQKTLVIGVYPAVSLKQAREARDHAKAGIDPSAAKREAKAAEQAKEEHSFEKVAGLWYKQWKQGKNVQHATRVWKSLVNDVFPLIGHKPVAEIQAPAIVSLVKAIGTRGAVDTAKRTRNVCSMVFRYAIAHGYAERNPVEDVKPADILPAVKTKHQPRVDGKELPALMRAINAYQGKPITRIAMLLLAHTFVRTSELIQAQWSEFDLQARRWDI